MEEVINFFETHHQSRECSMVAVKVAAHHDVFMDLQLPTSIRTISVCTGLSEIVGLECTQR